MKLLTNLFLVCGVAFTVQAAPRDQSLRVNANLPFAFEFRGSILPAIDMTTGDGPTRLVIHRYGYRYFVAEVWVSGRLCSKLPCSRAEKALIRSGEKMRAGIVVLNQTPAAALP